MKFQNNSIPGSKVMLCTRKHDKQTNARTDKPEARSLPTFFKVGGIKKSCGVGYGWWGGGTLLNASGRQILSFENSPQL